MARLNKFFSVQTVEGRNREFYTLDIEEGPFVPLHDYNEAQIANFPCEEQQSSESKCLNNYDQLSFSNIMGKK